jgi:hypothetical protein
MKQERPWLGGRFLAAIFLGAPFAVGSFGIVAQEMTGGRRPWVLAWLLAPGAALVVAAFHADTTQIMLNQVTLNILAVALTYLYWAGLFSLVLTILSHLSSKVQQVLFLPASLTYCLAIAWILARSAIGIYLWIWLWLAGGFLVALILSLIGCGIAGLASLARRRKPSIERAV